MHHRRSALAGRPCRLVLLPSVGSHIFTAEQEDPLQRLLLDTIKAQPGINRKGLHKATGGHLPAATLMQALVAIRDQGLVQCQTASTGGRPAERWYPCELTKKGGGNAVLSDAGLSSFVRSAACHSNICRC